MYRKLNWKPSFKDHKRTMLRTSLGQDVLPALVDLRPLMSPVQDQGQIGSCSGNAAAACVEFLEIDEMRNNIPQNYPDRQIYINGKFEPVSRLFIYFHERDLEGSQGSDAGATTLQDACITVTDKGACSELIWPYEVSKVLENPSHDAYADAARHKVKQYLGLDFFSLKECLASGHPFMFGIPVYPSFFNAPGGKIPFPGLNEIIQGGHALCCVGYDDSKQVFIFKNSWGTSWGDNGYGYLPCVYMEILADDFFTLRR